MAGGVGVPGFEPGTSSLSATRSNQLSYTPETSHTSARRHTVETLRWQRRRCILGTVRWVSNRVHLHFAVPSSKRGRVLHLGAKLRRPEARKLAVTLPGAGVSLQCFGRQATGEIWANRQQEPAARGNTARFSPTFWNQLARSRFIRQKLAMEPFKARSLSQPAPTSPHEPEPKTTFAPCEQDLSGERRRAESAIGLSPDSLAPSTETGSRELLATPLAPKQLTLAPWSHFAIEKRVTCGATRAYVNSLINSRHLCGRKESLW